MDSDPTLQEGYVAFGINPEYSVTVHKSTFNTAFIAFTIFFGLALLAITIVMIILSLQVSVPPPVPNVVKIGNPVPVTLQTNYGGVAHSGVPVEKHYITDSDASLLTTPYLCAIGNNIWTDDHCICRTGYYGPECKLEKHDKRYFAVGTPYLEDITINESIKVNSDSKSFTPNSCSKQCDNTENCKGFLYTNTCTLITGDITVAPNKLIPYNPYENSTLYMKSSENIHFVDKVYIGKHIWNFPPRYWLVESTENYQQMDLNKVYEIRFTPGEIIMNGDYIGIYAKHRFSEEDWSYIIQHGDRTEFYIHNDHNVLMLPVDFMYNTPLYVMYK